MSTFYNTHVSVLQITPDHFNLETNLDPGHGLPALFSGFNDKSVGAQQFVYNRGNVFLFMCSNPFQKGAGIGFQVDGQV